VFIISSAEHLNSAQLSSAQLLPCATVVVFGSIRFTTS
jgi:hypothetical protein